MDTTIYFVRHSIYENPQRLVPGRIPGYHLSKEGIAKAKRAGEYLKETKSKHIYTSPLERTFETADIIASFLPDVDIKHTYELTEIDATQWQAYKLEDLFKNHFYEELVRNPDSTVVSENLSALAKRMEDFTLSTCKKYPSQQIICISHEFPIVALKLKLENKPLTMLQNYLIDMASITTLVFDKDCNFVSSKYKSFSQKTPEY